MEAQSHNGPAGKTILLIDDEIPLLKVNHRGLSTLGYHVLTASGGEEGLRQLDEHSVDMIILDMLMPGMDGVETLRRIRAHTPDQKVIILSAYAEPEMVEAVKELGILAYLEKPLTLKTMASVVHQALEGITDLDIEST